MVEKFTPIKAKEIVVKEKKEIDEQNVEIKSNENWMNDVFKFNHIYTSFNNKVNFI